MAVGAWLVAFGAHAESAAHAAPPHAPLPGSDGVYGRFDGDLALAAALGVELEDAEPRGALRASAHYLWTAGAYLRYADAFGSAGPRPARVLSLGVDLRPLFLPRFALDYSQGPALLDLTLDSLSLTGGGYLGQFAGDSFGAERGFEAGIGLGMPLLGQAKGPWLEARAERRWPDDGQPAWLFSVLVSLHTLTLTSDAGP